MMCKKVQGDELTLLAWKDAMSPERVRPSCRRTRTSTGAGGGEGRAWEEGGEMQEAKCEQ